MTFYNEIMIGIGVGLSVGLGSSYFLAKTREKNYQLELLVGLKDQRQFILDRVVLNTNCANALVLRISNCGGKLEEGEDWYSSVVAEAPESKDISVLRTWQNVPVDDSYKALIRDIQQHKARFVYTHTMPYSDLRTIYEAKGIIGSFVVELYRDDYFYYYMSFVVKDHWDVFTLSPDQYTIQTNIRQMKNKYVTSAKFDILKFDNLN